MPYQGVAKDIDLWGTPRRVGFYSSFTAVAGADRLETPHGLVEIARDPADGSVHALRGPSFAGVQFHPESVLSRDGMSILTDLLPTLLPGVITPAQRGSRRACRWFKRIESLRLDHRPRSAGPTG